MEKGCSLLALVSPNRGLSPELGVQLLHPRFLDALHLGFSAHFVYYYLVSNYGNPPALSNVTLSFKVRAIGSPNLLI